MYKVFIQNRPIFFISEAEIKKIDGIFVRDYFAITEKVQLTELLTILPSHIFLHVICEDPQVTISLFFENTPQKTNSTKKQKIKNAENARK